MNVMLNRMDSLRLGKAFSHRLPEISRATAALANQLALAAPRLSFPLLGGQVSFVQRHRSPDTGAICWEEIELLIADERFCLFLETSVLTTVLRVRRSPLDIDRLDGPAAALVLEHVLSETFEGLETAIGSEISVLSCVQNRRPPDQARLLSLEITSSHLPNPAAAFLIAASPAGQSWLVSQLCARLSNPPPIRTPDIPFPVTLNSPDFAMTVAEMRALQIGDLILLDKRWTGPEGAELRVAGRLWGQVRVKDGLLHLDDQIGGDTETNWEGIDMSLDTKDTIRLDDLPITLSLEIDSKEVSLQELSALVPGSVLPFSSTEPERVRLMANGRFFAEGELLKVDEQIGIRLTRLK